MIRRPPFRTTESGTCTAESTPARTGRLARCQASLNSKACHDEVFGPPFALAVRQRLSVLLTTMIRTEALL